MDHIDNLQQGVVDGSRSGLQRHRDQLAVFAEMFAAIGVEPTLRRGFALVTRPDGSVVRSSGELGVGDRVSVRLADGTVGMVVEEQ